MPAPIYHRGLHSRTPAEVHEDCVKDFATSMARARLWEGIIGIVKTSAKLQAISGELLLDSEFVELTPEPTVASLALLCKCDLTLALHDLWRSDTQKEWDCQTYLLPPPPTDPEELEDWKIVRDSLLSMLTDVDRKGIPVLDFQACHSHTNS